MATVNDLYSLLSKVNPDNRLTKEELQRLAAAYGERGKEPTNDGVTAKVGLQMISATARRATIERKVRSAKKKK